MCSSPSDVGEMKIFEARHQTCWRPHSTFLFCKAITSAATVDGMAALEHLIFQKSD